MKIELKNFDGTVTFKSIKHGETFVFNDNGIVWMKLMHDYHDFDSNMTYNAVALDDGTLAEFDDIDDVVKIYVKVVNE